MIRIDRGAAIAYVDAETTDEIAFVDAWVLGVLTVEDSGRITLTVVCDPDDAFALLDRPESPPEDVASLVDAANEAAKRSAGYRS